ncbi:tetratricopeptide repeat protein, partial [Chloroflexota bacterium]
LNNIGGVYRALGQPERALETYQEALSISREVKDRSGEGVTYANIAMIYWAQQAWPNAVDYMERCIQLFELVLHPSLADARGWLEHIKRERDGGGASPPPENQLQVNVDQVKQAYEANGAEGVSDYLRSLGVPDEAMDNVLSQVLQQVLGIG